VPIRGLHPGAFEASLPLDPPWPAWIVAAQLAGDPSWALITAQARSREISCTGRVADRPSRFPEAIAQGQVVRCRGNRGHPSEPVSKPSGPVRNRLLPAGCRRYRLQYPKLGFYSTLPRAGTWIASC